MPKISKPIPVHIPPLPPSNPIRPQQARSSLVNGPSTFTDGLPLPQLIVFDLDYTLWPFWVDTHVSGPVKPKDNGTRVVDRWGESFTFYPEVPTILYAAKEAGITMGLASRTHAPDLARDFLRHLVVVPPFQGSEGSDNGQEADSKKKGKKDEKPLKSSDYFRYQEIFPGSKTNHFQKMQKGSKATGFEIGYDQMMFFDDEARNRNVEVELGVTFWLVRDGVTKNEVDNGVKEWRKRRGIRMPGESKHKCDVHG